ncbi:hypothetical protein R1sor_023918 [Riccia sorocarpa]|uniref:Uncharacterized protein n=1 Tax=Riccia sorocarpa TaxID=122646 RepID=A0ABD3GS14_9MARC
MKDGGTFVRLTLEPKNMDRKTSKTALGGDLLSARDSQKAVAATNDTDSEEEREIARDVKASQRHDAERMVEAKAAKSGRSAKDKGKVVVQETQKKKPSVPSQAHREKLLGSSFVVVAAETGRNSRESKTNSLKRKRESLVTPPPPPKVPATETSESSEEEENIAFGKFGPIKTEGRFVSPATKMIQVFVVSDNDTETDESTKGEDLVRFEGSTAPSSFLAGSTLGVKGPQVEDQTASLAVASLKLVGLGGLLLNLKNGITSVFTSLQHVLAGKDMETVKGVTSAFKLYAGSTIRKINLTP